MGLYNSNFIIRRFHHLDIHMQDVVKGAGITFFIKVLGAVFSFCFNVLLARNFGAEGAGIYFLSLTLVTVMATLGRCGLDNTLLRYVAAHAYKNEWAQVKGVFQKGLKLSLIVSSVFSLLLYIFANWLSLDVFNKPELTVPLRIMSVAVVPLSLYWIVAEALKGLKKIKDSQLIQGFLVPFLTFSGLAIIGATFGVEGVSLVYMSTVSAVLYCAWRIWGRATVHLQKIAPEFKWHKIFESCAPLMLIQVMYLVMNWTSIFALGIWGDKADLGIFGAAQRTAMLISFILISVNSIVAPKFSAIYATGDIKALSEMAQKSSKLMTIISIPVLALFIFAPQFVMGIFGGEFAGGGELLLILSIGQFVNVSTGSVGYLLIMTGNERLMRNNTIGVGLLLIILNLILVPALGAKGAAISTAICMAALNIIAFFLAWRYLGIWTLPVGYKMKRNG